MSTEYSERAPHTRTYTIVEHGNTRVSWIEVNHRGIVEITEELLDQLMTRAGFTETTKEAPHA